MKKKKKRKPIKKIIKFLLIKKKSQRRRRSSHGREQDGTLIALKVEEEAGNQGGQVDSRNWKRQGNILP